MPTDIAGFASNITEERIELAKSRDGRVRELERNHIATWSEMAELCILVEEQRDWEVLGYPSWNQWLAEAAPQSRSAMYTAKGLLNELKDVPREDLREIPIGNAKTLACLPKRMRAQKKVIRDAKALRPKKFIQMVQEKAPELHIEKLAPTEYAFTESQVKTINAAQDLARIIENDDLSDEAAAEAIAVHYLQTHEQEWEQWKKEQD